MKRLPLMFAGLTILIVLCTAGMALAAPQQGMLVDKNGDPVTGFSNVWIENGVAYPVYNPTTHLWYSVFITGTGDNGVVICTIGAPLGTGGDFHGGYEGDDDDDLKPDADSTLIL
ncbi:MAG: hypothetical protein JW765_01805 [Deltaproteobacteria bacterium]|nr:hypothetical protein [Candidatus Zymogenaceae bacterium]